jgi:16S rRNA (adenine1518-N6/adenine1519-N6)-dimethyltransferase
MLNQLQNLPSISQVIDRYGLRPEKSLGQNFLLDTSITDQILINIPDIAGKTIIEVGPGPGCLTRSILAYNPKKLYTIEADPRCVKAMEVLQSMLRH